MSMRDQSIGIWGYGITGKSVLRHLYAQNWPHPPTLSVYEKNPITAEDRNYLKNLSVKIYEPDQLTLFLEKNEKIVPSPGIDLRPFAAYQDKWLAELDLFQQAWEGRPVTAITGSVGKTTVTHLFSEILKSMGFTVATGGNIGTGCLDLIPQKEQSITAMLEVSSFQLEHSKKFSPTLAIWTNLYPNHLDRHGTIEEYVKAKANILRYQKEKGIALIPWQLRSEITSLIPDRPFNYFCKSPLSSEELTKLVPAERVFCLYQNWIMVYEKNKKTQLLLSLKYVPPISYLENIAMVLISLHLLQVSLPQLKSILDHLPPIIKALEQQEIPEHRLEEVATINNIVFYNDSKATIPASTLAALEKLADKPIILFIGGISKGVDREFFIKELQGKVKEVYCFGKEAAQLHAWCAKYGIQSHNFSDLDAAFAHSVKTAKSGDCILFSPAGASFDLFSDYKERGNYFKQLIYNYPNN